MAGPGTVPFFSFPFSPAVGIAANTSATDLNAKVGSYANQQRLQAIADGDQKTADSWAEGGSSLVLLHGLVGALQGLSSGSVVSTAVGTAVVAEVLPALDQALKQTSLNEDQRNALAVMIAAGLGAVSTGISGGNSVAQINAASNSANEDKYNRQLHLDEINLLEKQANDLATAANISPQQALINLARGLAYYTDAAWRTAEGGSAPDALTLKYLGIALAPEASHYAMGSDVPQTVATVYTPAETAELLTLYSASHADFYDPTVNGQLLTGSDIASYAVQNFYQTNLNLSQGLSGVLSGLGGYAAGVGTGAYDVAQGLGALGNGLVLGPLTTLSNISQSLFQGITNPLDAATKHFDDADAVKLQLFLSSLQGDSYTAGKINGSQDITFALGMIPAGRLGVAGELAAAGETLIKAEVGAGLADVTGVEGKLDSLVPPTNPADLPKPSESQFSINRKNGLVFEQQVVDSFDFVGGTKNTSPETVILPDGTAVTTIPDMWGKEVGGLLEIKNVINLSMSDQFRAQIQLATETGQPLNLVVSPRT